MNKVKGIRPVYFITCLTFGITLFLIYAITTMYLIDSDSIQKISQLSKSTRNVEMKSNSGSGTANTEQLSDVSSEFHADQRLALLNKQYDDDRLVTSRGARNRDTDYKVNQIEKPIKTAASAAPTEVKSAAQTQPTNPAAVQPAAPAKVSSNTESHAAQIAPAKAASQYEKDLDLLARLITAEAQGEPYQAKVAVGAVVMNRVKSGLWENTIKGVIYQNINGYYQFTPVVNGWINKPAEPESVEAAKAAMSGVDPTNGTQFYYDDKVTNTWILSKPVSVQIGHMIYAY